jgi:peptide/nickel transport system ATP-binding protein/oligopeptide transport system ATP-binding protein
MSGDISEAPLLQVTDLRKSYRARGSGGGVVRAVDGVTFSVRRGTTFALVGESGCGKSTTGRAIVQLERSDSGTVIYDGEDIGSLPKSERKHMRRRVQMIFQDPYSSLNPHKTVEQILVAPLIVHGLAKGRRRERAAELLEIVGLDPTHLSRFPRDFSGGQRQRIGIARALAVEPELLVCDEPVSALDVSVQAQVLNLLVQLQEDLGLTYVFISHDLSVVNHLADRVGVMYAGAIVESASTEELFSNPTHPYTKALLSAIPDPDPTHKGERIILGGEVRNSASTGCRFSGRCPSVQSICLTEAPPVTVTETGREVACHFWDVPTGRPAERQRLPLPTTKEGDSD